LNVEDERIKEQENRPPIIETMKEEVQILIPMKDIQQREVTMPREDKNQNGKKNPKIQIAGKKARKLMKKKAKLDKLQKVPEGTP